MHPHTSSRSSRTWLALTSVLLALPSPSNAAFDCKDIAAQSVHFNLGKLGGPHTVHWIEEDWSEQLTHKYNFTLDICDKLKWHKGGSLATECHHGAQVCAVRETLDMSDTNNSTITPIDIAGTYSTAVRRPLDAQFELLRNSESNSDAGREGVRAALHGGRFPFDESKKKGLDQQAIIEFVCDKDRTGLEGDEKDNGEREDTPNDDKEKDGDGDGEKEGEGKSFSRRDEGNGKCEDSEASLRFCGYEVEKIKDKQIRTLRLEWRTQYACEDAPADTEGTGWGFFTWFIIILFLAIAAYLIFGSWLNYNRYGARGWDLLPHGDTIRDIPYLLKDWARRVVGTIQGPGSRGGYSAV